MNRSVSDEYVDREVFYGMAPGRVTVSRAFEEKLTGTKLRIAQEVVDGEASLRVATVKDEVVLRETGGGRYRMKATFVEDDRSIRNLSLERYSRKGTDEKHSFSLHGQEINRLVEFLLGIPAISLPEAGKRKITNDELRQLIFDEAQVRSLLSGRRELLVELAQNEDLKQDVVALGYRKKQLGRFERLLNEPSAFDDACRVSGLKPEALWQRFFEKNPWIFGYGLSYQFLSQLDDKKIEQIVRGADVTGVGKRIDGLLKTQARINSLCFVEIKRHDTALLGGEYRSGAYRVSNELAGAVAQTQATVRVARKTIEEVLRPTDAEGWPTGEEIFNIEPRSFVVIGRLDEFIDERGPHRDMVASFEAFRGNLHRPEIITFDELLARARFIVGGS